MSNDASPSKYNIQIGSSSGNVMVGDGNTINMQSPGVAALGLNAEQMARLELALQSLRAGADARVENADARELKAAAAAPDEQTRGALIKQWLLKIAPHAAGLAGSVINPVIGEVAKAATAWAAGALGNKD